MGVHYYSSDVCFGVSAPDITLIDSNGAGAIFASGFLAGFLRNMSPVESVKFGVAISSLSCEKIGTALPDINKINKLFKGLKSSAI